MNERSILLVGNFLSRATGTRSVCEELSQRLAANGWETIETSHHVSRIARLIDMLFTILFYSRRYRVAYVEVYSGPAFLWAELTVRLLSILRKPKILVLHGGGLVDFAGKNKLRVAKLLGMGELVATPSLYLRSGLRSFRPDLLYLPNAVDAGNYHFRLRRQPSPILIWLRAFHEIYQPELAVRVLANLIGEFPDATLIMIGPDKKDGSFVNAMNEAKRLGVFSSITVTGPIRKSEVPEWIAKGDIFLNTTRLESFGVGVLEAALTGLPIVSTSVGEIPFLWEHEQTAMLIPDSDDRAMASAVRRILCESELAEKLSLNARQKAESFDWRGILPQWENLFQGLEQA
ncbi:MAG: glycosyltransferase family 4 protein [Anaerolineales bacterium]|nr:glycosyltransferase family 4 protein [Anaerolineales bacterium]